MTTTQLEKINIIPQDDAPVSVPALAQWMTPMSILDRAISGGASVEVLKELMGLQDRHDAKQARRAFDNAMAGAKAEIPTITKNREVDFTSTKGRTHYRYEDLGEIARVVSPILAKHGLSYRYRMTSTLNEPVTVTCIVSHRDGHFEENTLCAGRDDTGGKNAIQQIGSTLTYLQRMTLKGALGIAVSNDDDGKASSGGAPANITDDQVGELLALIQDIGGSKPDDLKSGFLKYMKVEAIADIPAAKYRDAVSALNKKRPR
jgi:hypothetical protein